MTVEAIHRDSSSTNSVGSPVSPAGNPAGSPAGNPSADVKTEITRHTEGNTEGNADGNADVKGNATGQAGGVVAPIVFYVSHSVLLILFFAISIVKNVQYIYHRVFIRFLTLAYYPSKTPQIIRDDVNKLSKLPKRVATILDLKDDDDENGGIDGLINDISELTAWSISSGIPQLIIYEYNGVIGNHMNELRRYINKNLTTYFGTAPDSLPRYAIKLPHANTVLFSHDDHEDTVDLEIVLLSRIDGKPTIIELTKTMAELATSNELDVKHITIELIDEELVELVGPEPDLLISFGPSLDLQDYPPWHIRLSEIYWEPDNVSVNYAVFIRALQKFSHCKVNVGK